MSARDRRRSSGADRAMNAAYQGEDHIEVSIYIGQPYTQRKFI